ncbi:hypothetical protein DY000_02054040 [Brassica cretica]|uniref:Uncharacterized protein n=1 Tax=Brassica cretica TaxID=69181 RepID=A0ABQ7ALT5_BRACR|nr:hypothetical protein DY000_02054040 [Brassica cretica]
MEIDLRMLKMPWGCDEEYHVLYNKWLNLKDQNLRWENVAQKQTKLLEEVLEELATVKDKNESLEQEVRKLRKVQQKGLPRFVHGRTSESGAINEVGPHNLVTGGNLIKHFMPIRDTAALFEVLINKRTIDYNIQLNTALYHDSMEVY